MIVYAMMIETCNGITRQCMLELLGFCLRTSISDLSSSDKNDLLSDDILLRQHLLDLGFNSDRLIARIPLMLSQAISASQNRRHQENALNSGRLPKVNRMIVLVDFNALLHSQEAYLRIPNPMTSPQLIGEILILKDPRLIEDQRTSS